MAIFCLLLEPVHVERSRGDLRRTNRSIRFEVLGLDTCAPVWRGRSIVRGHLLPAWSRPPFDVGSASLALTVAIELVALLFKFFDCGWERHLDQDVLGQFDLDEFTVLVFLFRGLASGVL